MMKPRWLLLSPLVLLACIGCSGRPDKSYSSASKEPTRQADGREADNTAINERDRDNATLTPGDQGESDADRGVTQQVRQAIVADDHLSTTAQNVKIITVNGVVTLRGPVNTPQEKSSIEAKVLEVPGVARVQNELEIITR